MKLTYNNFKDFIDAKEIKLGINIEIGENTRIIGPSGKADYVEIGDNVFIDRDIFIMTPYLKIGDYSKIYKFTRISGYKPCIIGHNFWCDQNTILNCTDELIIGNNVGIGAYSQLWTHIKFGDILEGCKYNNTKPMYIEDDVWFVGHCIVSPIHAKKKSLAMVGSVVTKDMESNHIYGGAPAIDLTPKLGQPYLERTIEEKYMLINKKLEEFILLENLTPNNIKIKIITDSSQIVDSDISYFNVSNRTYTKRRTEIEIKFMKFLLPLFKFIPNENT